MNWPEFFGKFLFHFGVTLFAICVAKILFRCVS